jgi:hypothetical protein
MIKPIKLIGGLAIWVFFFSFFFVFCLVVFFFQYYFILFLITLCIAAFSEHFNLD